MPYLRRFLIAACVLATIPLVWRATDVAAEVRRERLAEIAIERGSALFEAARYAEAADAFRLAVANAPKNPTAYQRLADTEFKLGRIDDAIAVYRTLVAIYPYTYVALFYWEVAMIEMAGARYGPARADLLTAIELDPTEWRHYYFLGITYLRLGDLTKARTAWQHAMILNPGNPYVREELRKLDSARQ